MTSDTFIEDADAWRDEFWEIIAARPDVTFFLLTKRPERMRGHMPADWCDGWENVIVGLSCEDQRAFNTRWQAVLETPAKRRALNLAPLLGPIDIREAFRDTSLEGVTCGGECYGGRPCDLDWVRDIRSQCESAGVEFTFWSTGDTIVDDGVERHIPSSRQHGDALRAVPPYHASRERRGDRRFAPSRCWQCPALYNCEGCVRCGRCVDACTVAYDVLAEARRRASLPL